METQQQTFEFSENQGYSDFFYFSISLTRAGVGSWFEGETSRMSQWARSVYPHSFPATATVKMTMITMTKMTKMTMTTMKMVFADDNDKDTDDIIDNVDVNHP